MEEKQHLTYDDFYEHLWGGISSSVVSEDFIYKNAELIQMITFDLWRLYELEKSLKITTLRRVTESFCFAFLRFNSDATNYTDH